MAEFDPYLKWLGIREDTRPVDHYTLLGIERFEDDQDVIVSAADRQMAHVRSFQAGARGEIAQKVLNQLARARRCLMTEDKKNAYDEQLRGQLMIAEPAAVAQVEEFSEPPQLVPDIGIKIKSDDNVSSIRRAKSNNGMVWTIVGGLGGGVCAIVFCYFLLNGIGYFDNQELVSKSNEDAFLEKSGDEKELDGSEDGRREGDSSTHGRPLESPLVNRDKSSGDGGTVPDAPAVPAEPDGRALDPEPAPTPGVIYWGDATNVRDDADISTNGDLVIAVNAASKGVTRNLTVNGVKFKSTGALLAKDTPPNFDVFDRNSVDDPEMISAGYDKLLSSLDWGGRSPTIALAGSGLLIPGEQYEVQVWYVDTRKRNYRVMRFSDTQGNSVELDNEVARYAIGTFTASGANQELRLLPQGNGFVNAHINAYQVRSLSVGGRLVGNNPVRSSTLLEPATSSFSLPKFYSTVETKSEKKALPGNNEIRVQEALIESLYESEFKTAKDDMVAAHEFAKQLVAQASSSSNSPVQKYVLFRMGIDLAKKIGDGESAAIGFLGLQDEFVSSENWDEIHNSIDAIRRKVKTDEQARVFYRGVILLSQRAYGVGNFGEAEFLMGKGFGVARKLDHVTAESYFARIRDYFGELKEAYSLNSQTDPQLDMTSTDSPALVSRGNYLVYLKHDQKGFEYWAKSDDEGLSSLAKLEIEFAKDPSAKNQYELGKLWYERAKNYKTFKDHFGLARAAMLLRPLVGQLNGLQQKVATNFVDRIDEVYAPVFSGEETIGLFPSVLKNDRVCYFVGEDSSTRSMVPSGVYVQFRDYGLVKAYFEAGPQSKENGYARLSYSSSPMGISITGDTRYRISIHSTHQPMKLGLEFLDDRGRASKPIIFDHSPTPSILPKRFELQ